MAYLSLIDWIQIHFPKDTLNCRAWEGAWIIGVLHRIQYIIKQCCVRPCNALTCMSEAWLTFTPLSTYCITDASKLSTGKLWLLNSCYSVSQRPLSMFALSQPFAYCSGAHWTIKQPERRMHSGIDSMQACMPARDACIYAIY